MDQVLTPPPTWAASHLAPGPKTASCLVHTSFSGQTLATAPSLVIALLTVKRAAAIANQRAGILSISQRDAITAATVELMAMLAKGELEQALAVDLYAGGGSIALNVNISELIAAQANHGRITGALPAAAEAIDWRTQVNASQSTADVVRTALHLALIFDHQALDRELECLAAELVRLGRAFGQVEVVARTCLQPAMPTSLGAGFSALATLVERRRDELSRAISHLHGICIGGTVIGNGAGASEAYRRGVVGCLRELTGLPLHTADDLIDQARHMDDLTSVASALEILAGSLIKFAKDLRLMGSAPGSGFGELVLPAVQEGSTFFQGKVNPVVPETLLQCCFLVLGRTRSAFACLEHGELDLNVFVGTAGAQVLEAMRLLTQALARFRLGCLVDLRAAEAQTAAYEATLARVRGVNPAPSPLVRADITPVSLG